MLVAVGVQFENAIAFQIADVCWLQLGCRGCAYPLYSEQLSSAGS
jgi:hypothetical protein